MILALILSMILFANFSQEKQIARGTFISKCLSIIVLGSSEFVNSSEKCFDLVSRWGCYDILYLSANLSITPRANMTANSTNFQWALTNWLVNNSNPDSQVWIWIFSHGVGLHHHSPFYSGDEERWELYAPIIAAKAGSNECSEITEALIWWDSNGDGFVDKQGLDVNGDGIISNATWVGIDEGFCLNSISGDETIWDDDYRQWLNGTSYRRMVIFMSTCQTPETENETASCFSGGLIDDLSAPRRIIITCTNETYYGWANETTGIGWFAEPFMNALYPGSLAWNEACGEDGISSVLEAFIYARQHDTARMVVRNPSGDPYQDPWRSIYTNWREIDECPWMDDGGNFLPNFINGTDFGVNESGYDSGDGELARYTWYHPNAYSGCVEDINDDGTVDMVDIRMAASRFGYEYPQKWDSTASLADINEDNLVDMKDIRQIAKKFGWTKPPP
jgi:hypothetical protein